MGKINVYDKIVIQKPEKNIKYGNRRNFYMNLHLIDGLGMEFTVCYSELMPHHLPYLTHIVTL